MKGLFHKYAFSEEPRRHAHKILRGSRRIFIAYSHTDFRKATEVRKKIIKLRKDSNPNTVFLDQSSLKPGNSVTPVELQNELLNSDLLVVLCGRDTHQRRNVLQEIEHGIDLQSEGQLQILPIILKTGATLPKGIDFKIHGINVHVLFPSLYWLSILFWITSIISSLLILYFITTVLIAIFVMPDNGWTFLNSGKGGFDDAILVKDSDDVESIRTRTTTIIRGRSADIVDRTNDQFYEISTAGGVGVTGEFRMSSDDAGSFILSDCFYSKPDKHKSCDHHGTLLDDIQAFQDEEPTANEIWSNLSSRVSKCVQLSIDDNENIAWDFEHTERTSFSSSQEDTIKVFNCGKGNYIGFSEHHTTPPDARIYNSGVSIAWFQNTSSIDGGSLDFSAADWKIINQDIDISGIVAVSTVLDNSKELLFATNNTQLDDQGAEGGLFRSIDNGESWDEILPAKIITDVVMGLDASNRIVIAYRESEDGVFGIKVSDNNGDTWKNFPLPLKVSTVQEIKLLGILRDNNIVISLPGARLAATVEYSLWDKVIASIGQVIKLIKGLLFLQ